MEENRVIVDVTLPEGKTLDDVRDYFDALADRIDEELGARLGPLPQTTMFYEHQ